MRVERPAARMTAAMRWPFSGSGSARGCGRVTISISSPPTPKPVTSSRDTGRPASSRISIQSKPFSFGERAQPGAPRIGWPLACADQHQVAGIDRHAEMLDAAADRLRPRPGSRRGGRRWRRRRTRRRVPRPPSAPHRPPWRPRACSCGTRRSATMLAPAGASRASVTRKVFSTTLVGKPRQQRRDHADLLDLVGRDADERLAGAPRARP